MAYERTLPLARRGRLVRGGSRALPGLLASKPSGKTRTFLSWDICVLGRLKPDSPSEVALRGGFVS